MLIYRKTFTIQKLEEGSLLYPTINTVYLRNEESTIRLKIHMRKIYLEKTFKIDVRISDRFEVVKSYQVSINAIFHKIVHMSKVYVFEIVHDGLTSTISLPITYMPLFTPMGKVCVSIRVNIFW